MQQAAETTMKLMKSNGIEANVVTYTAAQQAKGSCGSAQLRRAGA